jgi:hypothetical protein
MARPTGDITNFPNGVSSFGIPVVGGGGTLFGIGRDAKRFFVNPRIGSDNNNGLSPRAPLATITQSHALMTSEAGDVCYYIGSDGGTDDSSRDTATITWSKSGCTLIGICAPVPVSQRARISPTTSIAGPLLTVSGSNNYFANFQLFQGHNAASTALSVTGQRNYFHNVHIGGIGHDTAGDDAASESLLLSGSENEFNRCTIGLDTAVRSAACAEIRIVAGSTAATRNYFRDCHVTSYADNAGALHVDIPDSGGIDRFVWFERCKFTNSIDSAATQMTVSMNIHATCGGTVYLEDCLRYGATDWAASFVNLAQLSKNSGTAATDMGAAINGS